MNLLLNVDWGFTMALVLTGLVVVFVALILLILIIYLFGKIMDSLQHRSDAPQKEEKKPVTKSAPKPQVVEVAAEGLSDEVIAAITGAISAILAEEGDGKSYVVRSIKRVRKNRHAWGRAGVEEYVRPF